MRNVHSYISFIYADDTYFRCIASLQEQNIFYNIAFWLQLGYTAVQFFKNTQETKT